NVGVAACAFEAAPAVIAAQVHAVHFLHRRLADVADPELPGRAVEAPAPWIAQPERENLRAGLSARAVQVAKGFARVRITRWNAVRPGRAEDLDAQHLAEQRVRVLRVADGSVRAVIPAAAVADARVEEAVRAEREVAAVVVTFVVRLRKGDQDFFRPR